MEQRDYLKEQIEQATRVVMMLIGDFLSLNRKGDLQLSIRQTNQQLIGEADFDVERLVDLPPDALTAYVASRRFTEEQLGTIARYLYEIEVHQARTESNAGSRYTLAALHLLDLADDASQNFDFARARLRREIEGKV